MTTSTGLLATTPFSTNVFVSACALGLSSSSSTISGSARSNACTREVGPDSGDEVLGVGGKKTPESDEVMVFGVDGILTSSVGTARVYKLNR